MTNLTFSFAAIVVAASIVGCSKKEPAVDAPKFDPKFIASEADKGNLAPLTELNNACSAEVQKHGKRLAACDAQDEVRKLAKPLSIRM